VSKLIAVTGKGGTGKTTTAALMIRHLKKCANGPILALDADPDANLATVLGIPVEKSIGDLREQTLKEMKNLPAGLSKSQYIEAGLHEIIAESEKIDLIAMGRSEGPGCYCFMNSLLRKFAEDLLPSYEWVVMDNEAGLEHLSRRTAARVDHLVIVINQSPLSVDCAVRIEELVRELKNEVAHRHLLLNAVPAARMTTMLTRLEALESKLIGTVPADPALEDAVLAGHALLDMADGPAVASIAEIMKKLGA